MSEDKDKKLINLALKIPAGKINESTPIKMLAEALIKKGMEKNSSLDFTKDTLCPIQINHYLDSLSPSWYTWLPETLYESIGAISDVNRHKVRAIQCLRDPTVCGNIGWDIDAFEKICIAFSNESPDFGVMELPSLKVVRYGYLTAKIIQPLFEIWDDVYAYLNALMYTEGLVYFPDPEVMDGSALSIEVKNAWPGFIENPVSTVLEGSEDNPLHVQIQKLMDIEQYVAAMMM